MRCRSTGCRHHKPVAVAVALISAAGMNGPMSRATTMTKSPGPPITNVSPSRVAYVVSLAAIVPGGEKLQIARCRGHQPHRDPILAATLWPPASKSIGGPPALLQ
jgi:hypothetical protein